MKGVRGRSLTERGKAGKEIGDLGHRMRANAGGANIRHLKFAEALDNAQRKEEETVNGRK